MRLVQVTPKKGLSFSISEYEEDDRHLKRIFKYFALAIYQLEDSPYGDIRIIPIINPLDYNGGYSIPDKDFVGFADNLCIDQVVESVRTIVLDGFELDDAIYLTMLDIKEYSHFTYMQVESEYKKKYKEI